MSEAGSEVSEDPLYDPDADERDARWVGTVRRGRGSDAVLSCPCCFTTLCVDCQQHDTEPTRYRAMFVMNCKVLTETSHQGDDGQGCPVQCDVCACYVGVYDADGVYHFFNVLPSTA